MKIFICAVFLLVVNGIWGMPTASDEDENDFGDRKYGIGLDVGGSYKAGAEVGIHASNGTASVFADTSGKGRANAGIGVYKSVKPYAPAGQNPPQYPPMYQPYPMSGSVPYPQYPQYVPYPPFQPYAPYPQYMIPAAPEEQ